MKSAPVLALVALLGGAAALGTQGAAASPPPSTAETGCHDLLGEPAASSVGATPVLRSVSVLSAEAPSHNALDMHDGDNPKAVDLSKVKLKTETFARGGVAEANLSLGAPVDACAEATYALELYDLSRRPSLIDDVRTSGALASSPTGANGVVDRSKVLLHALIDDSPALQTAQGTCANARLVVRDAAGAVVDVEPNSGFHSICTGDGGARSYSG